MAEHWDGSKLRALLSRNAETDATKAQVGALEIYHRDQTGIRLPAEREPIQVVPARQARIHESDIRSEGAFLKEVFDEGPGFFSRAYPEPKFLAGVPPPPALKNNGPGMGREKSCISRGDTNRGAHGPLSIATTGISGRL